MVMTATPEAPVVESAPYSAPVEDTYREPDAQAMGDEAPLPEALDQPSAPPADYVPKSEYDALQERFAAIEQQFTAISTKETEAQRVAAETQRTAARQELTKRLTDYGHTLEEADLYTTGVETLAHIRSPQFQQQIKDHVAQYTEYERTIAADKLVYEHLVPTISSNMTPGQAIKLMQDTRQQLLQLGDKTLMEREMGRIAEYRRNLNRQATIQGGGETIERGGTPMGQGATDFNVLERKYVNGTGPNGGLTESEFRRYMAGRQARGL